MINYQYIDAYKKTQQSSNAIRSSHEIVRTLMKELVNSMQKIVLDIQDERKRKQDQYLIDKVFEEKTLVINLKISVNLYLLFMAFKQA